MKPTKSHVLHGHDSHDSSNLLAIYNILLLYIELRARSTSKC